MGSEMCIRDSFEDGVLNGTERDRTTWLMRNTVAFDANEDIEAIARFNFAVSDSDDSNILDADFVEGVVGLAYRPVKNDRLNALAKYTYFEDLAPAQQLSITGASNLARQRSQIFSVDGTYDLTPRLTCLLYTSPSPRDGLLSRMPSSA